MKTKSYKYYILALLFIFYNLITIYAQDKYNIEKIINFLAFGTGSTTGTYFPLGNAFANVWTQKSKKINVMTHSTNGSYENIELLRNHEINLAIAQNDIIAQAISGKGKFQGKEYKDLQILMALYPEVIQIVVPISSKIEKISDLKGRRINVGAINSGNALTAIELLSALNLNENDYIKINLSYDEAIQAMEKNECDATIIIAGLPTKVIYELKKRIPIKIIDIPLQSIAEIVKKIDYMSGFEISDDIYGLGKNTNTLAVMSSLITNKNLKEEIGYDLIKMIFENIEYLKIIHERARDISTKNALRGIKQEYLHEGAIKYFKEIGILEDNNNN